MGVARKADSPVSIPIKDAKRFTFSKSRVEALPVPASGRVYWYDDKTPSLSLCVTDKGTKTFYVYKWTNGKPVRFRLGRFPEITVEQARKMTQETTGDIARGIDPQANRQTARGELTVGKLFEAWLEHAKQHKRTWKEDERQYNKHFAAWKNRRLSDVRKADVSELHTRLGKSGVYTANRALALLSAAFNYAIRELDWEGINPTTGIKSFKEESRDRFIQPDELPRFFKALESEDELFQHFFKMALLTGARRSNVQAMRWDEIQGDIWRIPETKNGQPVLVPLVPEALAIIDDRRKSAGDCP
jgi:hypothetical protein